MYTEARAALKDWRAIRDSFAPNRIPVWIDDTALRDIGNWIKHNDGIVWIDHVALGNRVETELGIPYYGERGYDTRGQFIEDSDERTIVASIASNSEGRNIQRWSNNLVTNWPTVGLKCEQLIGRTHREGQEADEVVVDVAMGCREHATAWWQSLEDSRFIVDGSGLGAKILYCDTSMPTIVDVAKLSVGSWRYRDA
jgi:hypothetical protein